MSADLRLLRWPSGDQRRFDELSNRLMAIRELADARRADDAPPPAYRVDVPNAPEAPSYLEKAQALYAHRRKRERIFGDMARTFYEPTWDIMLDLFVAHERGVSTSILSACVASCVPTSTALRWIRALEDANMVVSRPSGHDKRVRYVALTDQAVAMMLRYLDSI